MQGNAAWCFLFSIFLCLQIYINSFLWCCLCRLFVVNGITISHLQAHLLWCQTLVTVGVKSFTFLPTSHQSKCKWLPYSLFNHRARICYRFLENVFCRELYHIFISSWHTLKFNWVASCCFRPATVLTWLLNSIRKCEWWNSFINVLSQAGNWTSVTMTFQPPSW